MKAGDLMAAVRRAMAAYHNRKIWNAVQRNGMRKDFSWEKSAEAYRDIYAKLLSHP
jgi:starch synthase